MAASPAAAAAAAADGRWLALVTSLPLEDPAARMRMLRTLESLGAAVMREGVFLLPDTPSARQGLERLGQYISKAGGSAEVLHAGASSEAQQQAFRRLFDRSARYAELVRTVESLRVGFGITEPSALSRVLQKQRRELEAICALDFFPSDMQQRAKSVLATAEAEVRKLLFPEQSRSGFELGEKVTRRTWATRRPLWADRLACAWLIRRFVDPEARFAWLEKGQGAPASAIGFAFEGARFAAGGELVAFEAMIADLGLAKNPALARIGSIVHFLEAKGTTIPEAAGVQTLLQGAIRRAGNEAELLAEAEKTFDLLYEAYYEPPKR
jgi:hypothetical protein